MNVKSGFVSPAGDGIVRYVDFKKFFHNGDGLSSGNGLEDGKIHGKRDAGFIVRHFSPREFDGEIGLNAFERVFSNFKRFAR